MSVKLSIRPTYRHRFDTARHTMSAPLVILDGNSYLDLSNVLVGHSSPIIRLLGVRLCKFHIMDIIKLVTGQTGSAACDTWANIQKTDPVIGCHKTTIFRGSAYMGVSMAAYLIGVLPGNMTQEDRTLASDAIYDTVVPIDNIDIPPDSPPLEITTVMLEYGLVDNQSADITKAVGLIAARLYR